MPFDVNIRRKLRRAGPLILSALAVLALSAWRPWAPRLVTLVRGGEGPPTFVLLHGYGSTAEEWTPFVNTIAFPVQGRFLFPEAPETTVPPDGPVGGRAWWRLALDTHIPPGHKLPDLSATRPQGLATSASLVCTLLTDVTLKRRAPIVLGGFSQGAMVASEVVFQSDVNIAALVLMSGTLVDEAEWERNFARRRGLPVFMSHGRNDDVLPFEIADRYRQKLQAAGVDVTWFPFEGGHEVPAQVVVALNAFLSRNHLGR